MYIYDGLAYAIREAKKFHHLSSMNWRPRKIWCYKPSPFTFLDEIEAALDEKNTRKLIAKLKEFTSQSQFILITHNKDTMRESDSIFGVTMNKEIGISKVVPVKF